jgi:hypothetical protein
MGNPEITAGDDEWPGRAGLAGGRQILLSRKVDGGWEEKRVQGPVHAARADG